jgi:anaerobic selenocysteine-containing dehydrogenase
MTTHHRTCPLCEAMCGLTLELDGETVAKLTGDRDDPLSHGHICPKAAALPDLRDDPDRVRHPLKRVGQRWEEVSWEDALDDIAARIHALQTEHGGDSVAIYAGNPVVHNTSALLALPLLLKGLRTKNRFSATSVDQLPHMFAATQMLGHQLLLPVPDLDRTDLLVVIGANPVASNGSIMSAPGAKRRLEAIRARGGRVVVIDPRRTETAAIADSWLPIRPGTDVWLLLALLHVVFREAGGDLGHLVDHTDGLPALRAAIQPYTPALAAPITGIPEAEIVALARQLVSTPRAAVYGRMGTCTQEHGGLVAWLLLAVNAVTRHLDSVGGVMFATPAVDPLDRTAGLGLGRGSYGRWRSRVRDLPEIGGELPVAVLAEEMLTPGEGQIRALITFAGNPVLSTPNGRQLEGALEGLDLLVCVDPYIQETSRHAHYILPPTAALERDHYDVVFHAFAVHNTTRYAPPLLPAPPGVRDDGHIALDLLIRLYRLRHGNLDRRTLYARTLRRMGWRRMIDIALRLGPYGAGLAGVRRKREALTIAKVEAAEHGIDLGPLVPRLPERLPPEQPRVQLAPPLMLKALERLGAPPEAGLLLIGRRHVRSNNSWMHNSRRLVKGRTRCTLMVHPEDAAARGLTDGGSARVTSRTGEVVVPVEITDGVMPGVVSLPHGYGHHRQGTRLSVASEDPGVSANDLTDDARVDTLTGTAALNGVPVEVTAEIAAAAG